MKVSYDTITDTLTVIFKEESTVAESNEDKPGVILDNCLAASSLMAS